MRKYWLIANLTWQKAIVYRLDILLEVIGYLLAMIVSIFLWLFAFQQTNKTVIAGYSQREIISYLLIAGWMTSAFWFTAQGDRLIREIRDGTISNYLTKPVHIFWYDFAQIITGRIWQSMLSLIAFIPFIFLLRTPLDFTISVQAIPLFFVFLFFAVIIQFLIFHTAALLAFWMDEVWGVTFVIRVIADIAAGAFIPLALFAPFWQGVFNVLPFKYIVSVPVNTLLGRLTVPEITNALVGAVIWVLFLVSIEIIILKRGIRHYSAVGG